MSITAVELGAIVFGAIGYWDGLCYQRGKKFSPLKSMFIDFAWSGSGAITGAVHGAAIGWLAGLV